MNMCPSQVSPPRTPGSNEHVPLAGVLLRTRSGGVDRGGVGSGGCDDDVAMIMTVVVWGCRGVAAEGGGDCGYGVVRVTMVRC
ncbi:hypothetical protein Tco_1210850 [Tanacetum coccineum]